MPIILSIGSGRKFTKSMLKLKNTKLQTKYRLDLVIDESHETVHSFRFTKPGIISVFAVGIAAIIGLVYSILMFTPLRQTIPGYPDSNFRRDAIENAIRIDSLETAIIRWELYSESLMRVLAGEENFDINNILKGSDSQSAESSEEYLQQRDSALRSRVQSEEQFSVSSGAGKSQSIEGMYFFTPLKGVVSNGYNRATHPAVDITAPAGSVVKAALDGTVIYAGWSDEFGYTIQLQHQGNIVTTYKHNNRLVHKMGDKVKAGTPIAYVGNTGSLTTGDHLHFELWHNGEAVDPTLYINF